MSSRPSRQKRATNDYYQIPIQYLQEFFIFFVQRPNSSVITNTIINFFASPSQILQKIVHSFIVAVSIHCCKFSYQIDKRLLLHSKYIYLTSRTSCGLFCSKDVIVLIEIFHRIFALLFSSPFSFRITWSYKHVITTFKRLLFKVFLLLFVVSSFYQVNYESKNTIGKVFRYIYDVSFRWRGFCGSSSTQSYLL